MAQALSTELQLDALLSSGFTDAFKGASSLMDDLKKESADLRKQLMSIGKEADEIDKIGKSSEHLRTDFRLLERQINETSRAQERFGESRSFFRKAGIGARALGEDIKGIGRAARNTVLAITGLGTAAAVALSPSEEVLSFDQTIAGIGAIAPEVDATGIETLKSEIRGLSNDYGIAASEIADSHKQLTRNLGFEGAQETISAAVEFQTATGLSVTDLEEELSTARVSLGIDTPAETREFLELLTQAQRGGIKLDNIDLGDMETLQQRTGEDVFGEGFQREFITTLAFKQVDSFQFADYAEAFQEDFARAVVVTPTMDVKEIMKAGENIAVLEQYGLSAEDGILGAMQAFQSLGDEQQAAFREQLAPVLGEQTIEVIARGSEALPQITQQVDQILGDSKGLTESAKEVASTWSSVWGRIGKTGGNALGTLQEQFGQVFGPSLLSVAENFFTFIDTHKGEIKNFFTGIRDGITPVISKVWTTVKEAYPDIKQFATEVWDELRSQFELIRPPLEAVGGVIVDIATGVKDFLKEHPRLVATVISGVVAWKAYQIAAGGVSVATDLIKGSISHVRGHMHRLNAVILENQRVQGTLKSASLSISKVFSGIGAAALGAIPGIGAMGASISAALIPALPVILPVAGAAALLGGAGLLIYKNWDGISDFFSNHFTTIRDTLMFVFPPLGLLTGFAGVIKDNWEPIKEFFSTVWETVGLAAQVAWQGIQYLALSSVAIVKNVWGGITGFFGNLWGGVHDFFMASPLAPIFEGMVDGIKMVVSPLLDFFKNFWENVSEMAGKAIGWITGLFEKINKHLGGWGDELRKENEKLRKDLNIGQEIKQEQETRFDTFVDAGVFTRLLDSMHQLQRGNEEGVFNLDKSTLDALKENREFVMQIAKTGMTEDGRIGVDDEDFNQIRKIYDDIGKIHQKANFEMEKQKAQEVMEKPGAPSTAELEDIIKSYLSEGSQGVTTAPLSTMPLGGGSFATKEIVDVSLGILAETRKQTLLMENFNQAESPVLDVLELPMVEFTYPALEMPSLEMPTIETPMVQVGESPVLETPMVQVGESPVLETPMVQVEAPTVEVEDLATPAPADVQVQQTQEAAESETQPSSVTINFSPTINQQPGQSNEELVQMLMEELEKQKGTFLVQ